MFSSSSSAFKLRANLLTLLLVSFTLFALLAFMPDANAKARLLTMQAGVVAYSGPGEYYRPLAVFPARTELSASSQIVRTKDGAFYKVIVKLSEKKSVIGYVSLQSTSTFMSDKLEEDDLSKYGDVALVNKAIQLSFSTLRDSTSMYSVGYMSYLSPGFLRKRICGSIHESVGKRDDCRWRSRQRCTSLRSLLGSRLVRSRSFSSLASGRDLRREF